MTTSRPPAPDERVTRFGDDVAFLRQHTDVIVLSGNDGRAKIAVAPAWQGRVMTSSAEGDGGESFGWINRDLISSGKLQPHINAFGGEDRFWLGPEGGQFSIFFAQGASFDLAHCFTPAAIDTEPYAVVRHESDRVVFHHDCEVVNDSGFSLKLAVAREVRVLAAADALAERGRTLPAGVSAVAFESANTIKNTGAAPWRRETG